VVLVDVGFGRQHIHSVYITAICMGIRSISVSNAISSGFIGVLFPRDLGVQKSIFIHINFFSMSCP
jgi:hypothetical protein